MFSLASKLLASVHQAARLSAPATLLSHQPFSAMAVSPHLSQPPASSQRVLPADSVPRRYVRSKEIKRYFAEDGTNDPPVEEVLKRFMRLRWGVYIHAIPGRHKHLYRKQDQHKERLKQHVMTDRNSSFLYDNMLNKQWRQPKFYPEDPYEPYHTRTGVPWDYGNRKRRFYP